MKTPSGKIEIYSERLADIAKTWVLPKGDVISALPKFVPTWEMPGTTCSGSTLAVLRLPRSRAHPLTFHNLPWLREHFSDHVLINPIDAKSCGIANDDVVQVFNDRGRVQLIAKVTPRIMPGVCSIPQGRGTRRSKRTGRASTWAATSTRSRRCARAPSPRGTPSTRFWSTSPRRPAPDFEEE